ncbi:hypothetical protein LTR53_011736 [Teratosphaeriaceae sp. CCFEE 6253]|nr:hypothetical protein LTR53_011736 [Teratosphaeriaceae sp. CCFEE 6253]
MDDISEAARSVTGDHDDMIDPQLRDSTREIKIEPTEGVHVPLVGFLPGEHIDLEADSDAETPVPAHRDDGLFVTQPPTDQERMLAAQRKAARMFLARKTKAAISGAATPAKAPQTPDISTEPLDAPEITTNAKGQCAAFAKLRAAYMRKKKGARPHSRPRSNS